MFTRLLIANRGEIACRVIRSARRLGLATIAVYTDPDRSQRHVAEADEAWCLGPQEGYLDIERLIEVARKSGAEALHPGYGFLSENPALAEACEEAGIVFVGPPPAASRIMGVKDAAKEAMAAAGIPVVPGFSEELRDDDGLLERALEIDFPVMIKAVSGGGGRGMRRVETAEAFPDALRSARREALAGFRDDRMMIERFIASPRHIEIQVLADTCGNVLHLFERDCSLQRRWQKLVEEAPAPGMTPVLRKAMGEAAAGVARAIGYWGAGTVEFIAEGRGGLEPARFWAMEMNTRLQVEHPVTEMITGIDLVEWQLRIAAGESLPWRQEDLVLEGHAVEARICAEDPSRDFLPSTGRIGHLAMPQESPHLRIDSGIREGAAVTPYYDSLISKIIAKGRDRDHALDRLVGALRNVEVTGIATNTAFLADVLMDPEFRRGGIDTGFLDRFQRRGPATGDLPQAVVAAAAMQLSGALDAADAIDPWSSFRGWRLWGDDPAVEELVIDGRPLSVTVSVLGRGCCRIGEDVVRVHERRGAHLMLDFGDRIETVGLNIAGETVHVRCQGSTHAAMRARRDRTAGEVAGHAGDVTASLPGKVVAVYVGEGDAFVRGDVLVVLEAMKIELAVKATSDGVARAVPVAPGDRVEEGDTLVVVAVDG